jgi:type IV secretory pathway TrbF-like protein
MHIRKITEDDPQSAVYLAARREWNERYGSYIAQARTWRLTAFLSLGIAAVAVVGVVWIGSQNHVVPYVVQTDKLGDALPIQRADVAAPIDPRLIRSQLGRWINDVRSVYTDVAAQRHLIDEAYAMVDQNAAAFEQLNGWFREHSPFTQAQTEIVSVQVQSVLPLSANTWRVEWQEVARSRDGSKVSSAQWQAVITIAINPPTTDADILVNPTGLFVKTFNWQQRQ